MKRYYVDFVTYGHIEVYADNENEVSEIVCGLIEDGDGCIDDISIETIEDLEDDE